MNVVEAGKICRGAGFNWGRGAYWVTGLGIARSYPQLEVPIAGECYPDLTKGATRGVILDWAEFKLGMKVAINVICKNPIEWMFWPEKEHEKYMNPYASRTECYAKLCQWVKENSR